MGARIHVQLRKGKPTPILFPYGAIWEKTERELTIRDESRPLGLAVEVEDTTRGRGEDAVSGYTAGSGGTCWAWYSCGQSPFKPLTSTRIILRVAGSIPATP